MKYEILKKNPGILQINAIDNITKLPFETVSFRVTSPSGSVSNYTTESAVIINDAESGNWYIEDDGIPYCYQNSPEYSVKNSGSETLVVLPYDKKPDLEIRDLDEGSKEHLDGGSFEVYHQGKLIRSGLLQGKKLTFSNMDPGIYTVKQIKASEEYETDQTETQVNLELNKVISVSFFSHHSHD